MGPPPVYENESTTIVNNYYINEDNNVGQGDYQVRQKAPVSRFLASIMAPDA